MFSKNEYIYVQIGDGRLCKNSLYIASKYDIITLDKLCESWDAK